MKKASIYLVILFSLLCLLYQSDAGIIIGDYYGAACSSCTPGDPADVFCEDVSNSNDFWCSYTDDIDSGNHVQAADHSGSLSCTDKGNKAIEIFVDNENGEDANKCYTVNESVIYIQAYVKIVTDNLGPPNKTTVIYGRNGAQSLFQVHFQNISGSTYMNGYVETQTDYEVVDGGDAFGTTNWHEVEIYWIQNTQNGFWFKDDDAQYSAIEDETTIDQAVTSICVGSYDPFTDLSANQDITFQVDIWETDDDTMPTDCP